MNLMIDFELSTLKIRFWRNWFVRSASAWWRIQMCNYAKEQWISSLIAYVIFIRHLHHIFDPIFFLCCNVTRCQWANFRPRYLEKYVPHLFHFLENDYLHNNLQLCSKIWNTNFTVFMDTLSEILWYKRNEI